MSTTATLRTGTPARTILPDARLLAVSVSEVAAFLAVVDCEGFTAAARELHLSQPGVSSRIRRLEHALGVRLFDRSVRRLTLTPQGQAFLPEARALVTALATGVRRALTVQSPRCHPTARPISR